MTQGEKAKRYDKAFKEAEKIHKFSSDPAEIKRIEQIFPELAESEDERIRKAIIEFFELQDDNTTYSFIPKKDILTWLEKQGEHANFFNKIQIGDKVTRNRDGVLVNLSQLNRVAKPAEKQGENSMGISETTKKKLEDNLNKALEKETSESWNEFLDGGEQKPAWSEEDDNCLSTIIAEFSKCAGKSVSKDEWMRCNDFLNSLKGKIQPQPKQEWSEEDLYKIEHALFGTYAVDVATKLLNKIKSLRPQNRWKPSDEQMEALDDAIAICSERDYETECRLDNLRQDLKKLKQ